MTFDPTKFTFLPLTATVREFEPTEEVVKTAILAAIEMASAGKQDTASVDPIGPNNHPRMLQLSGWLTYADEVNKNYRMFTKADLEEVVQNGMFKAPFFGMIDYNHDFSLYGVWYDTKMAYDTVAEKWGIYAEGVIFAWRYTEVADKMLAMQARNGNIKLSMACLPEWYEPARTEDGIDYLVARKPVFFTTSVLDVDPAFPNSRAYGSEDPESTQEARAAELLKAGLDEAGTTEEAIMETQETASTEVTEVEGAEVAGAEVTPETASAEETVTETAAVVEEVVTETAEATEVAEVVAETATETQEVAAEATETVEELTAKLATATVALNAAKTEMASMTNELVTLREFKEQIEAARATAEAAARRESRMAELPDAVLAEMEKEENQPLLDEMMGYDEARWEAAKKVFAVASVGRKSRADKSAEEGTLSSITDKANGGHAISRWRNR